MDFAPEGPMAIPLWINGHALLTAGQDFLDVVNPVTGEAVRRVPLCGASEAAEATVAARAAQPAWAEMGLAARRVCLARLAEGLERYAGHFAKLLGQDRGIDEAAAAAEVARAVAALQTVNVGETGVVGVILDASQPLADFAEALAPAVLAGATVVVKPSPKAPSAVFALCELATRVEWPAGVVNLLQGDTAAVEGLCGSGLERIVYRGKPELGEQIGKIAARAGIAYESQVA